MYKQREEVRRVPRSHVGHSRAPDTAYSRRVTYHGKGTQGQIRVCLRKADLRVVPRTGQTGKYGAQGANGKVHLGKGDKTRNEKKNQEAKKKKPKTHKTQKWGSCNGEATWCSLEQNRQEDRGESIPSDKVSGRDGETRDTPRQLMELLQ